MTLTWNGKPLPSFFAGPSRPTDKIPDYTSHDGAKLLALMIVGSWRARGHGNVTAEAVPAGMLGNQTVWSVRTNLVNGLPPRVA